MPRQSLFEPRLVRDLLRRTLSTAVRSRAIDTNRLIESISRGTPLRRIPCTTRLSLRRGVQVLRDIGESMEPYVPDQAQLMAKLATIGGDGGKWDAARAELVTKMHRLGKRVNQLEGGLNE